MIGDDLEKGVMKRQWGAQVKERLKKAKRYLKIDFRVHCNPEEAVCPDHCRKLALSDEQDLDFYENCSHQPTENCKECQNLRNVLDEVEDKVRGPSWRPYSSEQRDDLLYDFKLAITDILEWKAHIVRSINQEAAKDWAERLTTSVSITDEPQCEASTHQVVHDSMPPVNTVSMGWALPKSRAGSTRFSCKVKNYLTAKFVQGEQSGLKADPQQVSNNMRKARDEQNNRLLDRDEWLTESQVQDFFSRLTANRKRQQTPSEIEQNPKELSLEEEEADRNVAMLKDRNVAMLKEILSFFEVPFKSRDRKKDLIEHLMSFIQECQCFNSTISEAA
ncbi:hypothetical protein AWC38_SpisGene19477 [Stylophora pistillata]|uniref:Uncharacterized protein n=1 Tax=Stylophora pistillata TaxID=50429 RepID=A0A2B4RIF8_STYPI|nr:hypothetical protein AWC38_SpisGene19477 [Stylophora pistillata]